MHLNSREPCLRLQAPGTSERSRQGARPQAPGWACLCLFPVASADPQEERVSLGPVGQHAGALHGGRQAGLSSAVVSTPARFSDHPLSPSSS